MIAGDEVPEGGRLVAARVFPQVNPRRAAPRVGVDGVGSVGVRGVGVVVIIIRQGGNNNRGGVVDPEFDVVFRPKPKGDS